MIDNSADEYELCPRCCIKVIDFGDRWLDAFYIPIGSVWTVLKKFCQGLNLKTRVIKNAKKFYDLLKCTTSSPWQYFC